MNTGNPPHYGPCTERMCYYTSHLCNWRYCRACCAKAHNKAHFSDNWPATPAPDDYSRFRVHDHRHHQALPVIAESVPFRSATEAAAVRASAPLPPEPPKLGDMAELTVPDLLDADLTRGIDGTLERLLRPIIIQDLLDQKGDRSESGNGP